MAKANYNVLYSCGNTINAAHVAFLQLLAISWSYEWRWWHFQVITLMVNGFGTSHIFGGEGDTITFNVSLMSFYHGRTQKVNRIFSSIFPAARLMVSHWTSSAFWLRNPRHRLNGEMRRTAALSLPRPLSTSSMLLNKWATKWWPRVHSWLGTISLIKENLCGRCIARALRWNVSRYNYQIWKFWPPNWMRPCTNLGISNLISQLTWLHVSRREDFMSDKSKLATKTASFFFVFKARQQQQHHHHHQQQQSNPGSTAFTLERERSKKRQHEPTWTWLPMEWETVKWNWIWSICITHSLVSLHWAPDRQARRRWSEQECSDLQEKRGIRRKNSRRPIQEAQLTNSEDIP